MSSKLAFALLALAAAACSREQEAAGPAAAPPAVSRPLPAQLPRSRDPQVAACTAALESGDLPRARTALLELGEREALDGLCLRARLLAAEGDAVGAVREIEAARKRWPDQACLYATLAEIHATGGRQQSAQDEIRAGLAAAGPTPELERARGVLLLLQQGGAKAGLGHLLNATKDDPGLPFCRAPLSEAHRLLATEALGKQHPVEALAHAKAGLELEPDNPELRLLRADALIAESDYDAGLEAYEELARAGRDLGAALRMYYQRGATAALVDGRPAVALERYVRARQLGASDEELGHGAEVLRRAVSEAQDKAEQAYAAEQWNDARTELERALRIEPENLAAETLRGVVCFKLEDFKEAEASWRRVLERAEREKLVLPDPVHLKLASALHALGRDAESKPVLERYLETQPQGEWADLTREALQRLAH